MSHDSHANHHSHEAEQNEIGGPVLFAIICVLLAVAIIVIWSS